MRLRLIDQKLQIKVLKYLNYIQEKEKEDPKIGNQILDSISKVSAPPFPPLSSFPYGPRKPLASCSILGYCDNVILGNCEIAKLRNCENVILRYSDNMILRY